MTESGGLWDGRWVVCRAHTLAQAAADARGDDPGPAIVGLEHLPPSAQPSVVALVGDLARPVDAQVALPLAAGGHALLTLRGDPAHVEVVVRGAGPRPDPDPGETLVTVLPDGRRAELIGVAACVIDPDGTTAAVSPALADLAGVPARVLARDGIVAVVDPADHGRVLAVARGMADDAVGVRIQPSDGGPTRWVDIRGVDLQPEASSIADPAPTDHGRLLLITELHARAGDLARAAHRASAAFLQAPSGRARLARDGTIAAANPAMARFFQADPDHLIGHLLVDLIDHGDRAALSALLDAVLSGDLGSVEHEVRLAARVAPPDADALPRPDEPPAVWVRIQVEAVTTAVSTEADVELHDITSRRRAESDQRDTVDALRSAFIHAPTPMAVVELDGTIREANSELRALLDLGGVDSQRVRLADLSPEDDRHLIDSVLAESTVGRRGRVECRLRRHDGSVGVVELSVSAVTTPDHLSPFAIAQVNDITSRRDTEEKLLHQTLHDPLTGLGNRLLLRERLERATTQRAQVPFALMFIDLDHFKWINDTHGHEVGDALLVEVAGRLRDSVRTDDTVARLGGDEFVVLAMGVNDPERAGLLAGKVRAAIAEPISVEGHVLGVTASVGVVLSGSEHTNADALLRDADLSMYQAKSTGRDRHQVTVGADAAAARPPVSEALRLALATDSLRLFHQPVIDLRTGRAVGTEALLRVADPVTGTRPPGRLLDGVTDAELLVQLGGWVLDHVLEQMQGWDDAGIGPLSMWLNLSGPELTTDSILERVSSALTSTGVDATRINIEIPEPTLLMADSRALDRLRTLAALGVRLGIDDFGTGSASLAHLRSLPMHFLKIDPSIGRRLREPGGRAVVEAVVAVGRALGLDVIAEGIEDQGQLEVLAQLGCTHAQGNLFAAPAPAETLTLGDGLLGPG
ncbi:EAL domain-containing protein [Iamia sp. SCSIO 61187]|uniref:sensor domain-containing protein n=1 Tax=Iamia sp. SCSIO 61187 TaxID=2722752 RepID=UPI001C62E25C|nr:EAL domain-containing protein [Iamia sp. SCSIO 61187]QYG90993.1 EAL domain-containing protein [Iamia sp. SCSIO 61187]